MKTLFLGNDVAPSTAFARVQQQFPDGTYILGHGKGILPQGLEATIMSHDAVIIGLSTPLENAAIEVIATRLAKKNGKFLGAYGDMFGSHSRAVNTPLAEFASEFGLFLALDETEAKEAQGVFLDARCVATGNPLWEDYRVSPGDRAVARDILKVGVADKVILSGGVKSRDVNFQIWEPLKHASEMKPEWQYVVAVHPGDNKNLPEYQALFANSRIKLLPADIRIDAVSAGADAILDYGSSPAVQAGFRRIPHLTVFSSAADEKRQREMGGPQFVNKGVSLGVRANAKSYVYSLETVFNRDVDLRQRQIEVFGDPKPQGTAVDQILEALGLFVP